MRPEKAILLRESQIQLSDMRKASADRDFYEVDRALLGEISRLKNELEATKKAKAENDERFMLERDAARVEREKLKGEITALTEGRREYYERYTLEHAECERINKERDAFKTQSEQLARSLETLKSELAEEREIKLQQASDLDEARVQKDHWEMKYQRINSILRESWKAVPASFSQSNYLAERTAKLAESWRHAIKINQELEAENKKLQSELAAIRERKVKVEWAGGDAYYDVAKYEGFRIDVNTHGDGWNLYWKWKITKDGNVVKLSSVSYMNMVEAKSAAEQALAELCDGKESEPEPSATQAQDGNIIGAVRYSSKPAPFIGPSDPDKDEQPQPAKGLEHYHAKIAELREDRKEAIADKDKRIADLEAKLSAAAKQLDEPCDNCPTYEAAMDELEKLLDVKLPFGEDGRAWQVHHVVDVVKVLKAKAETDHHDAEEYRRIVAELTKATNIRLRSISDCVWIRRIEEVIHPNEKG